MNRKNYKPNTAEIIYQLIDREYILLNLSNGNYFSLDNLGVLIWECVLHSIPDDLFLKLLSEVVPEIDPVVTASVPHVFDDLLKEGLSVYTDDVQADTDKFLDEMREKILRDRPYLKPAALHAYKNIQEKYAHPCGVKEI